MEEIENERVEREGEIIRNEGEFRENREGERI